MQKRNAKEINPPVSPFRKWGNLKKKKNFFPSPFESPVIKVQADDSSAMSFPRQPSATFYFLYSSIF